MIDLPMYRDRPGVEIARDLLEILGHPEDKFKIIHIAGTNGKSSVACYTAALIGAAGHSCGLMISPHILHIEERIRTAKSGEFDMPDMIGHADYQRLSKKVLREAEDASLSLTFSDLILGCALLYFAECGCEYAVLECGLGGRYDSTNAIADPAVCVITGIGLDHVSILGDTTAKVASEKACIIKAGTKAVLGAMDEDAFDVMKARCEEQKVPYKCLACEEDYRHFNLKLARAVLSMLGIRFEENEPFEVAGRLQKIIYRGCTFYFDGAHNRQGAKALAEALKSLGCERCVGIASIVADKDADGILTEMSEVISTLICMDSEVPNRKRSAHDLKMRAEAAGIDAIECADQQRAVDEAIRLADRDGSAILVFGSFHIIGEIYELSESPTGALYTGA